MGASRFLILCWSNSAQPDNKVPNQKTDCYVGAESSDKYNLNLFMSPLISGFLQFSPPEDLAIEDLLKKLDLFG